MSRRLVLTGALVALVWAAPGRAQVPFSSNIVPNRTSLARLGLERQWMAVAPLAGDERLLAISMAEDLLFAQTSKGFFHVFNSESGQHLWTSRLGKTAIESPGASVNSYAVVVTNMNTLFVLDRKTGRPIWSHDLGARPTSSTAADEDRAMVGLVNGKIYAYNLKDKDPVSKKSKLADKPLEAWNWQTDGEIHTRPLPAGRICVFGSDDGKVYTAFSDERTLLYRIATGGPIGTGFGTVGTRLLLAPSGDNNLYGIDVLTARILWTFASGAPIKQEPMVGDEEIFVVNSAGFLSALDPNNGSVRWTTSTHGGRLLSIGTKRVYLESDHGDLFIVDRSTGQTIFDPKATRDRIGLDLRLYEHGITNRLNDRLFFATSSGMIISLRELGQTKPRLLRDAKSQPFAYIPPEGVSLNPPLPAPPTEPPAEEKPAEPGGVPAPGDPPK